MKTRVALGVLLLLSGCATKRVHYELPPGVWDVRIQGVQLDPSRVSENCVEISGDYPGFLIQSSVAGRVPTLCASTTDTRNLLALSNVTVVATGGSAAERTISFEHQFPPGPSGRVTGHAELRGVFTGAAGTGVPSGDSAVLRGYLVQNGQDDLIGKPLAHKVGGTPESAVFETSVKKEYLTAGQRTLRGVLSFTLGKPGHKLVLAQDTLLSLESVGRLKERTEAAPSTAPNDDASARTEPSAPMPAASPSTVPAGPAEGAAPPYPSP